MKTIEYNNLKPGMIIERENRLYTVVNIDNDKVNANPINVFCIRQGKVMQSISDNSYTRATLLKNYKLVTEVDLEYYYKLLDTLKHNDILLNTKNNKIYTVYASYSDGSISLTYDDDLLYILPVTEAKDFVLNNKALELKDIIYTVVANKLNHAVDGYFNEILLPELLEEVLEDSGKFSEEEQEKIFDNALNNNYKAIDTVLRMITPYLQEEIFKEAIKGLI